MMKVSVLQDCQPVLVTYGGSRIECKDLRRRRHKSTDTFVIIFSCPFIKK
ncbi:hypothetical protein [Pasteurella multocida]